MQMIDFMNQNDYTKEIGTTESRKTHPKFVLIRPDGTILYSDLSNDEKMISIFGKEEKCMEHRQYIAKLIENFFPDRTDLKEKVLQGNIFAPIYDFLKEGDIIFNNTTTYEGPTFFLHGIHGQLLIPENPTESQIEALKILDAYINYFKTIEVKEYQDLEKNIKVTYFENGAVAVKNFLDRRQEYGRH